MKTLYRNHGIRWVAAGLLWTIPIAHSEMLTHCPFEEPLPPGTTLAKGRIGKALVVPAGGSCRIPLPENARAAGTVEIWVREQDWTAADPRPLTILEVALGGGKGLRLAKAAGPEGFLVLARDRTIVAHAPIYDWYPRSWKHASATMPPFGWHCLMVTWDERESRLFVDGDPALAAAGMTEAGPSNEAGIILGGPGNTAAIAFDELRIHSGALPAKAVASRYRTLFLNQYPYEKPRLTAAFLANPPAPDGKVSDNEWKDAAGFTGLSPLGERRITRAIRVLAGYDAQALYLGFVVPYEGKLVGSPGRARDKHEYVGDNLEMYFDPSQGLEVPYYQLVGNVFGSIIDSRSMDETWDGDWEWKTDVQPGQWTAEARIPFATFAREMPGDGNVWGANFTYANPWMHWALAHLFHSRRDFGHLVFDRTAPVVRMESVRTEGPGAVELRWRVRNPTRQSVALDMTAHLIPTGAIVPAESKTFDAVALAPGETREFQASLPKGKHEQGEVEWSVRRSGTLVAYGLYGFGKSAAAAKKETAKKEDAKKEGKSAAAPKEKKWSAETLGQEVLYREKWDGNPIGISDEVLPPWTPIAVKQSAIRNSQSAIELSVWGREYVYDNTMLPCQIRSQGMDLLAAPARLVMESGGQTVELKPEQPGELAHRGKDQVVYVTRARAGGATIVCRQTLEYDGMLRVDLELARAGSAPVRIDRLALEIPMAKVHARYYHVVGENNQPPHTDVGEFPATGLAYPFRAMLWLGNEDGGLCWFAEDDRAWHWSNPEGLLEAAPTPKGPLMRVRFVSAPCEIRVPRTITFGLQATPTRPRPANWRTWHISNDDSGADGAIAWRWFWGPDSYTLTPDEDLVRDFVKKCNAAQRPFVPILSLYYYRSFYGDYRSHPADAGAYWNQPRFKDKMIAPEHKLWGTEWELTNYFPPELRVFKEHAGGESFGLYSVASSFQDYFIHRFNHLVDRCGLTGIYLDQPMLVDGNAIHGSGYIDCQGRWRGQYIIFGMRNTLKRLHHILYKKHGYTRIMFHMSSQVVVPIVSFADIFYDGEVFNCGPLKVYEHYTDVISLPRYRIQLSMKAFGPVPMFMSEFTEPMGYAPRTAREFVGFNLLHDVISTHFMTESGESKHLENAWRGFVRQEGVEHYPYWKNGGLLRVEPGEMLVSCYRKDRTLFLVATNADREATREGVLTFDFGRLGAAGAAIQTAQDALSGERLRVEGATLRLPVRSRDVRLVRVGW